MSRHVRMLTNSSTRPASLPNMTRFRTTCRVIAGFYLVIVLFAVLWDSGAQIAMLKESLGPWFLDAVGKDIVLNLVMLAPLTFLAVHKTRHQNRGTACCVWS